MCVCVLYKDANGWQVVAEKLQDSCLLISDWVTQFPFPTQQPSEADRVNDTATALADEGPPAQTGLPPVACTSVLSTHLTLTHCRREAEKLRGEPCIQTTLRVMWLMHFWGVNIIKCSLILCCGLWICLQWLCCCWAMNAVSSIIFFILLAVLRDVGVFRQLGKIVNFYAFCTAHIKCVVILLFQVLMRYFCSFHIALNL